MLRKANSDAQDDRTPPYGAELGVLQRAILATVLYRDLFEYPVTIEEIHRYLHGVRCELSDVRAALLADEFLDRYLETDGHYFAVGGREALFEIRRRRESYANELWPIALLHARRLAGLPFVRMVAVTGSLAVDNPSGDADTDFMLVTESGRLWTARAMAKVLQHVNVRFSGGELCVNHLVSLSALELEDPSLYVAQEIAQMVPVYGADVYDRLRSANSWSDEFLPNACGPPPVSWRCAASSESFKRLAEPVLNSPLGSVLESWESRRKIRKYNESPFLLGRSTPFRKEATGHRHTVKKTISDAFADRQKGPSEYRGNFRILFAQAYHLYRDPKLWRSMQPFPPLGSLYGAAVARSLGHDVRVHDSMLSTNLHDWHMGLRVHDPDVVVLYEDNFNYLTKMCLSTMRDAALEMITAAKERGATVLVCSSDSADAPEAYLRAGADFILVGEGEHTLADLLQTLNGRSGVNTADLPGIAYLGDDGNPVTTGRRPVIRHVDDLPLPAWDLIDLDRYRQIWRRRHGRFALNMVTTRGCPYHCNWCAKPIWGQRYNARSPESVVEELVTLREFGDIDYIWFMDDIFGLKSRWISRFADLLQSAEIKIRFKCLSRPDLLLRDGEVESLARAGCDIVWMGAESGSQKILDLMEKGTKVEEIPASCEKLREHGIRAGLFIQFGYPGETRDDIRATLKMIRRVMPDELGISVSYPLPGTRFYDRVRDELGEQRNWQDSDDLAMLFDGPFNTRFYRALHGFVHSDVALRRAWRDLAIGERRRRLSAWRRLRKIGSLGVSVTRLVRFRLAMAAWSRAPHRGMRPLPTELTQQAAATPTAQPGE